MRKILLSIIIAILLLLTAVMLLGGIKIGNFQILSINQMMEKNSQIDMKIAETNKMISIDYPEKNQNLKEKSEEMLEAKNQYLKLTASSTETEILKATMQEGYQIDFLYTTVGNHAKSKSVWTEMKIVPGDYDGVKDIKFTVEGSYVGITDFIYEIENNSKLNFRIKEFKLLPKDNTGNVLRATFVVKNLRIEGQLLEEPLTTDNNQNEDEKENKQNEAEKENKQNTVNESSTNTVNGTNTVN